jgi:hypothetical protein
MKPTLLCLETLGDKIFPGFTSGDGWNGWACPYFSFEVALQIVGAFQAQGAVARYDEAHDVFVFESDVPGESEEFGLFEVKGRKLYPLGAGSWIWEEVETGGSN